MSLQTNSLVYSPAVRISVACRSLNGEVIDLSDDLMSGSLTLNNGGVPHTLSFSLANQNGKYSSVFTPNDRISVQMKRLQWVTVFSGYLTSVPYFSLYPDSVKVTAQCTLKKLQYQQWDPSYQDNLNWMTNLIQGAYAANGNQTPTDAGMGAVMQGIVTQVAGWAPERVHIGGIPPLWFQNLQPIFQSVENEISQLNALQAASSTTSAFYTSGGSGSTGGTAVTTGATGIGDTGPTWNGNSAPSDGGANLPASTGQATQYGPTQNQSSNVSGIVTLSENIPLNVDPYWSAVPWPYYGLDGNTGSGASETSAIAYLKGPTGKGLPLLVTNQDNNKQVVVRAADFEEARYGGYPNRLIDLSPTAFSAISGSGTTSEGVLNVQVQFCDDPNQTPGAVSTAVKVSPNHLTSPVSQSTNQAASNASKIAAHVAPNSSAGTTGGAQATNNILAQATGGAAAATVALQQVGVPYLWGGTTPAGFDCSGLVYYAWESQGINISVTSESQYANPQVTIVDISQIEPGDLLFVGGTDAQSPPSHVAMYVGNNQVVEASGTGSTVSVNPLIDPKGNAGLNWWGLNPPACNVPGAYFMGVGRVTPTPLASAAATKSGGAVSADVNGVSATGLSAGGSMIYGNGSWNPGAAQADTNAYVYSGLRLLMNPMDTGVLSIVSQICAASQRDFCSAPNGDFISWFPDYFGQYGYAGIWELNPIELMSTQINWSDASFKTHQFVTGSSATYNASINPTAGGIAPQYWNAISSLGIASIDVPGLLEAVTNVSQSDSGLFSDPNAIYEQFGPRTNSQSISYIAANSPVEFWMAVQAFRLSIAQQFTTSLSLTFMPELWPGMILRISELGFQAYITNVSHSFDLGSTSGGFQTTVTIMAPSATDGSGLIGLAKSGSVG